MKKTILLLVITIFLTTHSFGFCEGQEAPNNQSELPDISAECCVVIEEESGRILYGKMPDYPKAMASTTKIMTAYVALKYGDLAAETTVSENASKTEGSSMYLEAGETITLENLLYGLMLVSGNDAAVAIAEMISGDTNSFVELMNKEAQEMGLKNTHFDNPNGLPSDNHKTTATELAKITVKAFKYPKFLEIVKTKNYSMPFAGHE